MPPTMLHICIGRIVIFSTIDKIIYLMDWEIVSHYLLPSGGLGTEGLNPNHKLATSLPPVQRSTGCHVTAYFVFDR